MKLIYNDAGSFVDLLFCGYFAGKKQLFLPHFSCNFNTKLAKLQALRVIMLPRHHAALFSQQHGDRGYL
jgi:hypothetical protein